MYIIPHSTGYINATIALLSIRVRFHTLAFFSPFFTESILVKSVSSSPRHPHLYPTVYSTADRAS